LSDNAKAYHSRLWQDTCAQLDIARRYTRPYTPRTNGKAEALIKTMQRMGLPLRLPILTPPHQSPLRLDTLV